MRIGPKKLTQKSASLHDWADDGFGVANWVNYGFPSHGTEFAIDQLAKFNLPYGPELDELLARVSDVVLYYTDNIDPYSLLIDLSDVALSSDWESHTFELLGNPIEVAKPEKLETYVFAPGQAEYAFDYIMSRPSLTDIPRSVGHGIQAEVWGLLQDMGEDSEEETLLEFCEGSHQRLTDYAEIIAWASFAWLAGPLGRDFRKEHNLIHEAVIDNGEAIMYEWEILSPRRYRKHSRAAYACRECGLDSYCNELIEVAGAHQYLCEHCLSQGLVLYSGATCGSRVCKYVECSHHPYHSNDRNGGLYQTMRQSGLLLEKKSERLLIA